MMVMSRAGLAAVIICLPSFGFAAQPTAEQKNAVRQLCQSDYQSHCAGIRPGGSAALACLEQNAASLSPPCQQALSAMTPSSTPAPASSLPSPPRSPVYRGTAGGFNRREEMAQLRGACGADYRQFCYDVQPGHGRGLACLIAHKPQLSPVCSTALASARHAR